MVIPRSSLFPLTYAVTTEALDTILHLNPRLSKTQQNKKKHIKRKYRTWAVQNGTLQSGPARVCSIPRIFFSTFFYYYFSSFLQQKQNPVWVCVDYGSAWPLCSPPITVPGFALKKTGATLQKSGRALFWLCWLFRCILFGF